LFENLSSNIKVVSKCLKLDVADVKKVSSENKQYFKCAATTSGHSKKVWVLTSYVNRIIDFKSDGDAIVTAFELEPVCCK
jgi:hypothetical protein